MLPHSRLLTERGEVYEATRTVALFAICLTALLSAAGCSEKGTESFNAVITEITEDGITARPFEDEEY